MKALPAKAARLCQRRPQLTRTKPTLLIVDGSVAITGALVAAARQAQLLADDVDTVLVLPRNHQVEQQSVQDFAKVITLPIVPLRRSVRSVLAYFPALLVGGLMLRREMRRLGCERLQLNDFYLLHGAMLRLLGFRGRIVTFVRIDPTRFGLAGRFWLAAARWSSTELVAVSRFIQSLLGPNFPTRLIYGQGSHFAPRDATATSAEPMFLFVGNIIEGKGQDLAVQAFHRVAGQYPAARLRFVGGDMGLEKNRLFRRRLEALAANGPAAGRIEFRGATTNLSPDYAEAYAALNFSASESFSITCLDASAAGLPLVATRCGGPEEIVDDGKTGFLVPVGDVAAMAERMAWLLDHPDRAAAMGAAGRALVAERFSADEARAGFRSSLGLGPQPA
jgi:glycosyltransferase involved in cell wall biosynthesis